jgi:hypothetical protein
MTQASSSLRSRVLAAAAATQSPTRSQGRRAAAVLVAASVAIAVAVFEGIGGLSHGSGRPLRITLTICGGWVAVSSALTWLVLSRGRSTMTRRPALLAVAAALAPAVLYVWTQLFAGRYEEPFQRAGFRCLAFTLVMTAAPLTGFLLLRRAVEPRYPSTLGAAAGAVCAAWAGVPVDLWCPLVNPKHVLLGHVVPMLVAVLWGAVAGRWTLGVRRVAAGQG